MTVTNDVSLQVADFDRAEAAQDVPGTAGAPLQKNISYYSIIFIICLTSM